MEDIHSIDNRSINEIVENKELNSPKIWLILALSGLMFIGVVIAKQLGNKQQSSTVTVLSERSIVDEGFSKKIKEEKTHQAFLIKAQASL